MWDKPDHLKKACTGEAADSCGAKKHCDVDENYEARDAFGTAKADPIEQECGWQADQRGIGEGSKEFTSCFGDVRVFHDKQKYRNKDCDGGHDPNVGDEGLDDASGLSPIHGGCCGAWAKCFVHS